jgi:cation transport ATPase
MKIITHLLFPLLMAATGVASAKTVEMDVNGLVCAFCAQGIEKTMKGFPATDGVLVSLEHRIVAVHLKEGQDIADATLRKAITDAGYSLVAVRRTDESLAAIKARIAKEKAAAPAGTHKHDGMHMHGDGHGKH